MCLLTAEVMRKDRVNEKVHTGFKVFFTSDSGRHLFPLHVGVKKYYRKEEWYSEGAFRSTKPEGLLKLIPVDRKSLLTEEGAKPYPFGFHIFTYYEDAVRKANQASMRVVRLVEYKEVVARGKRADRDSGLTIVARWMRIPKLSKTPNND